MSSCSLSHTQRHKDKRTHGLKSLHTPKVFRVYSTETTLTSRVHAHVYIRYPLTIDVPTPCTILWYPQPLKAREVLMRWESCLGTRSTETPYVLSTTVNT